MSIRLDYLPKNKDIKIYQDDEMFCINTDTMVLGEFLDIYREDVVLDIGTNTGALMLYASRFSPKKIVGMNNVKNWELIHADGNTFRYKEEIDVVIFNPPYFKTPSSDKGNNKYLALAKHEDNFSLENMIKCISRNLRNNGTLFFLFQTSRLNEVIKLLNQKNIIVKKLKFVYDANKDFSNVVLIKAVKGAKDGMIVEKPIIIDRVL